MTDAVDRLKTALAGRYTVERELGSGGMATVYLAEDMKHHRQVALKVLRPELAAVLGAERFVQEITTTANLQHPHILPLFDSGEADGFLYYVMPFIDGETLRHKLNRETQLGIEEAVNITTDIADALDYAHRHNVIHRDIKPENILLHDGRPMVADFGIALAVSAAAGGRMTETGLSLGTPHYMSPEQATAEKDLTNRSDIYSLGSVLYEMLTGEPPHTGASPQAIIMKIVTDEAQPVTQLRKSVPPHVAAATVKSLEKLAADRFESAAKFAEALTNPAFTIQTLPAGKAMSRAPDVAWWKRIAAVTSVLAALLLLTTVLGWFRTVSKPVVRFSVRLPEDEAIAQQQGSRVALSPDGSKIVYVGPGEGGGLQLWLRNMDQLNATPLRGTGGACCPAFSPEGDAVAYFEEVDDLVRVVALNGAPPITVADSGLAPTGVVWGADGYLYLQGENGLARVPAAGGTLEDVSTLSEDGTETSHQARAILPNAKGVLVNIARPYGSIAERDIAVVELETGTHRVLTPGVWAEYAASGHLLYVTADGALLAAPFDQDRLELTGPGVPITDGIGIRRWSVDMALSANGTRLYGTGNIAGEQLVWVSRNGALEEIERGWAADFESVALSPDGSRLALSILDDQGHHLWIKELPEGPHAILTLEGTLNFRAWWFPDNARVMFVTNRGPANVVSDRALSNDLLVQRADGSAAADVQLDLERALWEGSFSPDGEWLVYRLGVPPTRDIFIRRTIDDTVTHSIASDDFEEVMPTVSPDGRWLAYQSDES
jgi:serine/threonine-protein kinase